jgi:putative phage-type endonuclease
MMIQNSSSTTTAIPLTMEQKIQIYLDKLKVTPADVQRIMSIAQRDPEWIRQRWGRCTASNYGSIAGHNPYQSQRKLLSTLLWDTFKGNKATEYGNKFESVCAKLYENFANVGAQSAGSLMEHFYPGLIICQNEPWLAVSPDGLPCKKAHDNSSQTRYLLEIKCPFTKKLYPHIPHYYFDQIQGIMAILKLPFCDFVVWTPEVTQVRRYNFDPSYWKEVLYPRLRTFYFQEYLPRLILKEEGLLREGELEIAIQVKVDRPLQSFDCATESDDKNLPHLPNDKVTKKKRITKRKNPSQPE